MSFESRRIRLFLYQHRLLQRKKKYEKCVCGWGGQEKTLLSSKKAFFFFCYCYYLPNRQFSNNETESDTWIFIYAKSNKLESKMIQFYKEDWAIFCLFFAMNLIIDVINNLINTEIWRYPVLVACNPPSSAITQPHVAIRTNIRFHCYLSSVMFVAAPFSTH